MTTLNTSKRMDRSMMSEKSVAGFRVGKNNEKNIEQWQFIPKDVNILQLACTSGNWFCLSTSGWLFSWGSKTECLGRKLNADDARNPTRINIQNTLIVAIATGRNHVLALNERGEVYTWGKNDFGQLGHGNKLPVDEPKQVLSIQKDQIVQIYAGDECSFAVNKRGLVYAWGQNSNRQVSDKETEYEDTPNPLVQCPWDNTLSTRIVYGRDNASYIYHVQFNLFNDKYQQKSQNNLIAPSSQSNILDLGGMGGGGGGMSQIHGGGSNLTAPQLYSYSQTIKKMDYQIKDLQKTCEEYKQKLKQKGHIFGDEKASDDQELNQKQGIGGDQKNDQILIDITINLNELARERQDLETKIKTINMEKDSLEKEIQVYKKEEEQLQKKEEEYIQNKKNYEFLIREIQKDKNQTANQTQRLTELQRNLMTTKEILQSNDDLKNKAIMKQNNSEEAKNKAKSSLSELERRREEIVKKENMFTVIREERKKYLKSAIFDEKKVDLEKWIIIIHSQLKQLKETGIKEICRKQFDQNKFKDEKEQKDQLGFVDTKQRQVELNFTGIDDLAKKSNSSIEKIQKGLKEIKLNPNDPSSDIISKVVEIIDDNIICRKQINDLTVGLLIQTSTRNQQFQLSLMKQEAEFDEDLTSEIPEEEDEDYIRRQILKKYDKIKERQQNEYELLREYVQNQKLGREMHDPLYGEDRYKKQQKVNKDINKQKSGAGLFNF
ncbi:hypothetical protein ABPG74_012159 [Tetrahymena malaccensis]